MSDLFQSLAKENVFLFKKNSVLEYLTLQIKSITYSFMRLPFSVLLRKSYLSFNLGNTTKIAVEWYSCLSLSQLYTEYDMS